MARWEARCVLCGDFGECLCGAEGWICVICLDRASRAGHSTDRRVSTAVLLNSLVLGAVLALGGCAPRPEAPSLSAIQEYQARANCWELQGELYVTEPRFAPELSEALKAAGYLVEIEGTPGATVLLPWKCMEKGP